MNCEKESSWECFLSEQGIKSEYDVNSFMDALGNGEARSIDGVLPGFEYLTKAELSRRRESTEMTPEEKVEYDRMVEGAEQISLFDIFS